jgi:hypothetical protein
MEHESVRSRESVEKQKSFVDAVRSLINKQSREGNSNTPDYILAQYIDGCLLAFEMAVQQRETWHGRDPRPSHTIYGIPIDGPHETTSLQSAANVQLKTRMQKEIKDLKAQLADARGELDFINAQYVDEEDKNLTMDAQLLKYKAKLAKAEARVQELETFDNKAMAHDPTWYGYLKRVLK